jgi:hypothetical protein
MELEQSRVPSCWSALATVSITTQLRKHDEAKSEWSR